MLNNSNFPISLFFQFYIFFLLGILSKFIVFLTYQFPTEDSSLEDFWFLLTIMGPSNNVLKEPNSSMIVTICIEFTMQYEQYLLKILS